MPQLDISTYIPQIFWFLICFAVLYTFVACIILPRITNILKERKRVINADLFSARELDSKIDDLQTRTEKLRREANHQYQTKLDETAKAAAKEREKLIEDLKEKIDQTAKKSRQELHAFIEKTNAQSEAAVKNLVQKIKEKFLSRAN